MVHALPSNGATFGQRGSAGRGKHVHCIPWLPTKHPHGVPSGRGQYACSCVQAPPSTGDAVGQAAGGHDPPANPTLQCIPVIPTQLQWSDWQSHDGGSQLATVRQAGLGLLPYEQRLEPAQAVPSGGGEVGQMGVDPLSIVGDPPSALVAPLSVVGDALSVLTDPPSVLAGPPSGAIAVPSLASDASGPGTTLVAAEPEAQPATHSTPLRTATSYPPSRFTLACSKVHRVCRTLLQSDEGVICMGGDAGSRRFASDVAVDRSVRGTN